MDDTETLDYNSEEEFFEKIKQLINSDLSEEEFSLCFDLVKKYESVFTSKNTNLTGTTKFEHKIEVVSDKIINIRQYRFPPWKEKELIRQINDLKNSGMVVESDSPYNNPMLLVEKRKTPGKPIEYRPVLDVRELNKIIKKTGFPMPRPDKLLFSFGNAKYFTSLDLKSSFFQIPLSEDSMKYTAFSTSNSKYMYTRLPQGIVNSGFSMQQLMNHLFLGKFPDGEVKLYLDDVLIATVTFARHIEVLGTVLEILRGANLFCNIKKCLFAQFEIEYIGYIINQFGLSPSPRNVAKILSLPPPTCVKETQRFLGLINFYRNNIPNCAKILDPLYSLLRKDAQFVWGSAQQAAFDTTKKIITSPPILKMAIFDDENYEFVILSDASATFLGAVLCQRVKGETKEFPICFKSKALNETQRRVYTVQEKECLGVVFAIKEFESFIGGRKFYVYTDHAALVWLFNKKSCSRVIRWILYLQGFDFTILHRKGKDLIPADFCSRPFLSEISDDIDSKNE